MEIRASDAPARSWRFSGSRWSAEVVDLVARAGVEAERPSRYGLGDGVDAVEAVEALREQHSAAEDAHQSLAQGRVAAPREQVGPGATRLALKDPVVRRQLCWKTAEAAAREIPPRRRPLAQLPSVPPPSPPRIREPPRSLARSVARKICTGSLGCGTDTEAAPGRQRRMRQRYGARGGGAPEVSLVR